MMSQRDVQRNPRAEEKWARGELLCGHSALLPHDGIVFRRSQYDTTFDQSLAREFGRCVDVVRADYHARGREMIREFDCNLHRSGRGPRGCNEPASIPPRIVTMTSRSPRPAWNAASASTAS